MYGTVRSCDRLRTRSTLTRWRRQTWSDDTRLKKRNWENNTPLNSVKNFTNWCWRNKSNKHEDFVSSMRGQRSILRLLHTPLRSQEIFFFSRDVTFESTWHHILCVFVFRSDFFIFVVGLFHLHNSFSELRSETMNIYLKMNDMNAVWILSSDCFWWAFIPY